MIKKTLFTTLAASMFVVADMMAQTCVPVSLSGFNADVILEKGETAASHVPLDKNSYIYYSKEVRSSGGLVSSFTSATFGVPYELADFTEKNALRLTTLDNSYAQGTLTFSTPVHADLLFFLGMSANGRKDLTLTVHYSDGSSEEKGCIGFHDWYGGRDEAAVWGLGRRDKNSVSYDSRLEFGLFEAMVPVNSDKMVKSVDLKVSDSNDSYSAVFAITAARDFLFEQNSPLFIMTNSHLDTQWNWDITTTIDSYVKATLEDNLARLDKFPHYRFNFEGAVKYQWMKEYYPEKYEKLRKYVEEGRWNPSGGSWDANETMVSSAESLLRNLLYGQTFYKREFGKKGGTDIMLPDCFGFSAALPSIAAHCGFTGFHSQKLSWGSAYNYDQLPSFGRWRGVDGSEIYCILKPGAYDQNHHENLAFNSSYLNNVKSNEKNYGLRAEFRYAGKMGDRGGAQSEDVVDWLEQSQTTNGPLQVKIVSPTEAFQYMADNDHGQYKVVDHELPMRTHGAGCYTSQTMMKYWNRRNEQTGDAAERSSVVAGWLGNMQYPYETLTKAWQRVILHQFHDDLPGTSIPKAYYYSHNDEVLSLQDFRRSMNNAMGAVSQYLNTDVQGMPVVVYNPLSVEREDVVECELPSANAWSGIVVHDVSGKVLPAQLTEYKNGRQGFIFVAKVPSLSFSVFDVSEQEEISDTEEETTDFKMTGSTMENSRYRMSLNTSTGDIRNIYDKQLKRELLNAPLQLTLLPCRSTSWPAWEIPYSATTSTPIPVKGAGLSITIAEDGPVRKTLRVERTCQGSTFVQYISLTSAGAVDRVDVRNEVDWQSHGYLLKLDANLRNPNPNATYDSSLGFLSRPLSTSDYYEYAGHGWADQTATNGLYGVSILNDCKYGWDKPANNRLRLSLVYSPEVENNYSYQRHQDVGLNVFCYSIFSHSGNLSQETVWQSERLNRPLEACVVDRHPGDLGSTLSFVSVNTDKVAVKALKRAEDSDETIIRVYELTGEEQSDVSLQFAGNILDAEEVNGLEEPLGPVTHEGKSLSFSIRGFQPKTFRVRLERPAVSAKVSLPDSYPVELNYNTDVISMNDRRNDGSLAALGCLLPGELLPDTLDAQGIPFAIGPKTNGKGNALTCKGQVISLPENHKGGKLYLLAFSTKNEGSVLKCQVDDTEYAVKVDYAMGMIGQWGTNFTDARFRSDEVAFTATHSHGITDRTDLSYRYFYLFKYAIPVPADARELVLPALPEVYIMAATVSDCRYDEALPLASPDIVFPTVDGVGSQEPLCGSLLTPTSISASGQTNTAERGAMVADLDPYTKWCDNSSANKWVQYTFNKDVEVCQMELLLAASEGDHYVAREFRLQCFQSNRWVDVLTVTDNTENRLLLGVEKVKGRRFRLFMDKPEQNGQTARVYTFNLYGNDATGTSIKDVATSAHEGPMPVYNLLGQRVGTANSVNGKVNYSRPLRGVFVVGGRKVLIP